MLLFIPKRKSSRKRKFIIKISEGQSVYGENLPSSIPIPIMGLF